MKNSVCDSDMKIFKDFLWVIMRSKHQFDCNTVIFSFHRMDSTFSSWDYLNKMSRSFFFVTAPSLLLPFSLHMHIHCWSARVKHVEIPHGFLGINQISRIYSKICPTIFRMQSKLTTTFEKHKPTFKSELFSVHMVSFNWDDIGANGRTHLRWQEKHSRLPWDCISYILLV